MQSKTVIRNKFWTVVGDQKQLFGTVNSILGCGRQMVYPQHTDSFTLPSLINNYFITKIADIRNEFTVLESDAAQLSVTDFMHIPTSLIHY